MWRIGVLRALPLAQLPWFQFSLLYLQSDFCPDYTVSRTLQIVFYTKVLWGVFLARLSTYTFFVILHTTPASHIVREIGSDAVCVTI